MLGQDSCIVLCLCTSLAKLSTEGVELFTGGGEVLCVFTGKRVNELGENNQISQVDLHGEVPTCKSTTSMNDFLHEVWRSASV